MLRTAYTYNTFATREREGERERIRICDVRALAERFSRGVQINYFLQARDSDRPSSLRDVGNEDEVIQRKLGIALVIFSTDFRPFDDSTSFYTVRVFRHSPRTTPVGYLRLPERRIGTRTTGCARLIRESKLSCIIHYTPSLFFSLSSGSVPHHLLNRKLLEFSLSSLKGKFIALMVFTLRRKVHGVRCDQCSGSGKCATIDR